MMKRDRYVDGCILYLLDQFIPIPQEMTKEKVFFS